MAILSEHGFHEGRRHRPSIEYRVYFATIFVLALPFAAVAWALGRLGGSSDGAGVVRRALSEARTITPMIFSA
jgi:PufQ cytochrome subunit